MGCAQYAEAFGTAKTGAEAKFRGPQLQIQGNGFSFAKSVRNTSLFLILKFSCNFYKTFYLFRCIIE